MSRRSISRPVSVEGVGLHSGRTCSVELLPAPFGAGILAGRSPSSMAPIGSLNTVPTDRCTRLMLAAFDHVDMVEHLLAALRIMRISDCRIVFRSEEVPVLDGSAVGWLERIHDAELVSVPAEAPTLRVVRERSFEFGSARYHVRPGVFELDVVIDFPDAVVGRQQIRVRDADLEMLAPARTFVFEKEIQLLKAAGLARGGGLDNAVVVGSEGPLNAGGFRFPDECARHKALDLLGDLFVTGAAVEGYIHACRPGHAANGMLVRAMLDLGILQSCLPEVPSVAA